MPESWRLDPQLREETELPLKESREMLLEKLSKRRKTKNELFEDLNEIINF